MQVLYFWCSPLASNKKIIDFSDLTNLAKDAALAPVSSNQFWSLNDWRKSGVNQDKIEINSMDSKVRELNTAQLATVRPQDVRMLSLQDFLRLETVLVLNLLTFVIYIADQVRECEKVFLLNHCSPTRSGTKPSGTSLSPFWSLSLDFFIKDSSGLLHGEREMRNL